MLDKYANLDKEFICFDGSRVLSADKVNDDYCDCSDGSDEPGIAFPHSTPSLYIAA